MTRALSTVVDVTLCLLLVSASVGVLAGTDPGSRERASPARPVLSTMAATTASVGYVSGGEARRATGTLAGLLAAAARRTAGGSLSEDRFVASVRERVRRFLANVSKPVQVTARWQPGPNATIRGSLAIGPDPPARVDTDAARLVIRRRDASADPRKPTASSPATMADALPGNATTRNASNRLENRFGVVRVIVRAWWP